LADVEENARRKAAGKPKIPLSPVAIEALRGIALGRKSWLFCGSDRGGKRAAAMYTVNRLLTPPRGGLASLNKSVEVLLQMLKKRCRIPL